MTSELEAKTEEGKHLARDVDLWKEKWFQEKE